MKRHLKGKVAVVTGGGQGLGRALCTNLAQRGAKVAVCDIHADRANETVAVVTANGGTATSHQLDVRDVQSVEQVAAAIRSTYEHVDFLINNAGVDVTKPLETLSIEEWDNVVDTNLRGPFLMSKTLLADL